MGQIPRSIERISSY